MKAVFNHKESTLNEKVIDVELPFFVGRMTFENNPHYGKILTRLDDAESLKGDGTLWHCSNGDPLPFDAPNEYFRDVKVGNEIEKWFTLDPIEIEY